MAGPVAEGQTRATNLPWVITVAGNLALKVMATGGVYLGGGIPPEILYKLQDADFMESFVNKGRFAEGLAQIPVYAILNRQTALFGAACYGLGL